MDGKGKEVKAKQNKNKKKETGQKAKVTKL